MDKKKIKKPFYKRWWFIVLVGIVIISAIGGSNDNDGKEEIGKAEEPIELILDVEEEIDDQGRVYFKIETNLPNNTFGLVTLNNEVIDFTGQDKFEIKDGKGKAGPYSYKGEPFPSGTYNISVSTPISSMQPDDVVDKVGKDYKNYTGEKFKEGDIGRHIDFKFDIEITDREDTENIEDMEEQIEEKKQVLIELYNKVEDEYSKHKDNFIVEEWAEFGRNLNNEIEELKGEMITMSLESSLTNIKMLHLAYTQELQGREGDPDTFKEMLKDDLNIQ